MELYAGLDVPSEFTYGTIMDEKGNQMWEAKVTTSEAGFRNLFMRFQRKHKINDLKHRKNLLLSQDWLAVHINLVPYVFRGE